MQRPRIREIPCRRAAHNRTVQRAKSRHPFLQRQDLPRIAQRRARHQRHTAFRRQPDQAVNILHLVRKRLVHKCRQSRLDRQTRMRRMVVPVPVHHHRQVHVRQSLRRRLHHLRNLPFRRLRPCLLRILPPQLDHLRPPVQRAVRRVHQLRPRLRVRTVRANHADSYHFLFLWEGFPAFSLCAAGFLRLRPILIDSKFTCWLYFTCDSKPCQPVVSPRPRKPENSQRSSPHGPHRRTKRILLG